TEICPNLRTRKPGPYRSVATTRATAEIFSPTPQDKGCEIFFPLRPTCSRQTHRSQETVGANRLQAPPQPPLSRLCEIDLRFWNANFPETDGQVSEISLGLPRKRASIQSSP